MLLLITTREDLKKHKTKSSFEMATKKSFMFLKNWFRRRMGSFLTVNLSLASRKLNKVGDIFTPLQQEVTTKLFRFLSLCWGSHWLDLLAKLMWFYHWKTIDKRFLFYKRIFLWLLLTTFGKKHIINLLLFLVRIHIHKFKFLERKAFFVFLFLFLYFSLQRVSAIHFLHSVHWQYKSKTMAARNLYSFLIWCDVSYLMLVLLSRKCSFAWMYIFECTYIFFYLVVLDVISWKKKKKKTGTHWQNWPSRQHCTSVLQEVNQDRTKWRRLILSTLLIMQFNLVWSLTKSWNNKIPLDKLGKWVT